MHHKFYNAILLAGIVYCVYLHQQINCNCIVINVYQYAIDENNKLSMKIKQISKILKHPKTANISIRLTETNDFQHILIFMEILTLAITNMDSDAA